MEYTDGSVGLERLRVVAFEPADAEFGAGLLVRCREVDHIAREGDPQALEVEEGHQLDDAEAFHIKRAAPPDVAVLDQPGERLFVPELTLHRHHIRVVEEHERPLAAVAGEHGAQGDAVVPGVEQLVGDAFALEDRAKKVARQPFVAWRV